MKLPAAETWSALVESYGSFLALDVSHFDLVVIDEVPGWMVHHPHHVVYMLHPLRGLYDTYHLFGQPTEVPSGEPEPHVLLDLMRSPRRARRAAGPPARLGPVGLDSLGDDHPLFAFPGPLVRGSSTGSTRCPATERRRHPLAISRRVADATATSPPGCGWGRSRRRAR